MCRASSEGDGQHMLRMRSHPCSVCLLGSAETVGVGRSTAAANRQGANRQRKGKTKFRARKERVCQRAGLEVRKGSALGEACRRSNVRLDQGKAAAGSGMLHDAPWLAHIDAAHTPVLVAASLF